MHIHFVESERIPMKAQALGTTFLISACLIASNGTVGLSTVHADETQVGQAAATATPEIIAVKFTADWCSICKSMDPTMKEITQEMSEDSVLFVTFDMTNKATQRQSEFLASALGLESVWAANRGKAGLVALVHFESRSVVATLSGRLNKEQFTSEIEDALNSDAL